ncbi:PDDEXK family nuclease [Sediminitomix flava]|uniref:Uncharacterized protein n=1 Tax=Sediminitomix flava TaxID=379075 RepID=A0A315Z6N4_SEDFL|nr:hypothetical protein [Sediminitomix flava]PWJ38415.1 hypothetical protein BC781_1075 [Sediminitomix flava]
MNHYPQIFFPTNLNRDTDTQKVIKKPKQKLTYFLIGINSLAFCYSISQNRFEGLFITIIFSLILLILASLKNKKRVVKTPTKKKYRLKSTPAEIYYPNQRRGISEDILLKHLALEFEDLIVFDRIIEKFRNAKPYQPDLILHDPKSGIWFDIEIDEPYEIYSRKPIHFINQNGISIDEKRNKYFLSKNWVVIRFTEAQVLNNPEGCKAIVGHILFEVLGYQGFKKYASQVWHLVPESAPWSKAQSEILAKNNFREKMLRKYNQKLKLDRQLSKKASY